MFSYIYGDDTPWRVSLYEGRHKIDSYRGVTEEDAQYAVSFLLTNEEV